MEARAFSLSTPFFFFVLVLCVSSRHSLGRGSESRTCYACFGAEAACSLPTVSNFWASVSAASMRLRLDQ